MIKSVLVTNEFGESIDLVLSDPWASGWLITNIKGLGPAKANIRETDLATGDGANYNSTKIETRNIVFSIRLLEHPDIETSRQLTYKYFVRKHPVTMTFTTDNRVASIQGYVESNEPNIFSEKEDVQISIICDNPFFYAVNKMTVLNGVEPMFHFPFSNESLTEKLINFGEITHTSGTNNFYEGDTDSGVRITIHASGIAKNITLFNSETRERMAIDTSKIKAVVEATNEKNGITLEEDVPDDLVIGDEIHLSTEFGSRYIRLLRAGYYYNILTSLPKNSDWLTIAKGNNVFAYSAEDGIENLRITIESYILYEGI